MESIYKCAAHTRTCTHLQLANVNSTHTKVSATNKILRMKDIFDHTDCSRLHTKSKHCQGSFHVSKIFKVLGETDWLQLAMAIQGQLYIDFQSVGRNRRPTMTYMTCSPSFDDLPVERLCKFSTFEEAPFATGRFMQRLQLEARTLLEF